MIEIDLSNIDEIIQENDTVILGLLTTWDMNSNEVEGLLMEVDEPGLIVAKSVNPELAAKYSVNSFPSLLVFKNGILTENMPGILNKSAFLEKIRRILE